MSISRFQEKFLSQGCLTTIGIAMALVFVGGSFYACGRGESLQQNGAKNGAAGGSVVAEVDGVPVNADDIQKAVDQQIQQSAQYGPVPAEQEPFLVAQILTQKLQQAAILSMAKKSGITVSDDEIKVEINKQLDKAVQQFREQSTQQGKLKPGATDADLDKVAKAQFGQTIAELRKKQLDQIDKALVEQHDQVVAVFLQQKYVEQQAKANPATEADLRATFDNYTVKRIVLKPEEGKTEVDPATVAKVQADLKGGMKFEDAMNRYSKDLPMPGKKVADNTMNVTGAMMAQDESYKPLKGLKGGEVSEPAKTFEGTVIYKIISIKPELPKDFDKNKSKMLEDFTKQKVGQDLQLKTAGIAKGEGVVWKNDVYKALLILNPTPTSDPKARDANLRAAADAAKAAEGKASGNDVRIAGLLRYAALSQLANSPDANKDALRKEQIEAVNDILKNREDSQLRMTLVNLYTEDKNPLAGDALLEAAKFNSDVTQKGQGEYAQIAAKASELKKSGLIKPDTMTQIDTELARWRKDRAASAAATPPAPSPAQPGGPPGGTPPGKGSVMPPTGKK